MNKNKVMNGVNRTFINLLIDLDLYEDFTYLAWVQSERSIHEIMISHPPAEYITTGICSPYDCTDVWRVANEKWIEALEEYYELKRNME